MVVKPIPDRYHSAQPYLLVDDASRLMEFMKATFGAEDLGTMPTPEGKIGHAEMQIGDTIVMLADAAESSSRALAEPTPRSLRKLVHDLLMKRLLDGQFEESGLTLTELHRVEESLCKGLVALYHGRIKYPEGERSAA